MSTGDDPDRGAVEGRHPPSGRASLSRDRVVTGALALVDEHGPAFLTMRRLGADLGVEAMSLYRYVPGRDDLLDAVVERLVDEMMDDPDVAFPETGWQEYLQRLAHGVRRVALRHPRAFPLVASRPPEAPWLRPPLRSLAWVEMFLSRLEDHGFADEAAVAAYRGFTSFLLGHLLLEVASLGGDIGPLDVTTSREPAPGLDRYPHVSRLAEALAEDRSAEEFEESLENLLDRLRLIV